MKTSLSHLPSNKQQELQRVTQLIVETIAPEKIILYGSYATGEWQEDRYTEKHLVYAFDSDYDILVITKSGDMRKDYEITSQITNLARYRVPVNVITHDIDYINEKLSIGQYFFTEIIQQGIVLYDAGTASFIKPKELSAEEKKFIAQQDFDKWFSSALTFLQSAMHAKETLQAYKESVFLLHQSSERAYNTVLLVFTGYKPKTHNLDKLRGLTKKFSSDLYSVFPCNTKLEKNLFSLLQKGYIDARYNEDYSITEEELEALIGRVKQLIQITKDIASTQLMTK
jgi:HEPN domain-containing protein/predicted nucleotidyltransferase